MKLTARVRRLGGGWFVVFEDGPMVRFQSEAEAVLFGVRWVMEHRPSRLVLEGELAPNSGVSGGRTQDLRLRLS